MISYLTSYDKSLCCGCSACYNICPKKAITMEPDQLGFLYPQIQEDKCVHCNLCQKICSFNEKYDKSNNLEPCFYAVRHKKIEEIVRSRSGAAFVALTDYVLEQNGVIYGVGYKDHFIVCHKRAVTKEQRDEFRGSKYVQSDLGDVFSLVLQDLKNDKYVLFSGTGCQVAGIKSFLKFQNIDFSKLFLVDIVCHGVPSPFFWRDYLEFVEKKYGKKVISVNFRDKKFGWKDHRESFNFADNYTYSYTYTNTFYKHIMFRHSCERCFFTNTIRPSDITLADFWGWEKLDESFNQDNNGVSLVIVNTEKGRTLFDNIKDDINFIKTECEKCLQPNLKEPSRMNPNRENFENDYNKKGFLYVLNKYCDYGFWNKIKKVPKKLFLSLLYRIKKGIMK